MATKQETNMSTYNFDIENLAMIRNLLYNILIR